VSYPQITDYQDAVQDPRNTFTDPELRVGRVAVSPLGLPMPMSGGFALTYKVQSGSKKFAVRCFYHEVPPLRPPPPGRRPAAEPAGLADRFPSLSALPARGPNPAARPPATAGTAPPPHRAAHPNPKNYGAEGGRPPKQRPGAPARGGAELRGRPATTGRKTNVVKCLVKRFAQVRGNRFGVPTAKPSRST
jgi:hypothetical protein